MAKRILIIDDQIGTDTVLKHLLPKVSEGAEVTLLAPAAKDADLPAAVDLLIIDSGQLNGALHKALYRRFIGLPTLLLCPADDLDSCRDQAQNLTNGHALGRHQVNAVNLRNALEALFQPSRSVAGLDAAAEDDSQASVTDDSVERSEAPPAMPAISEIAVDGYKIERPLAEGGMGVLYLCTREETGEPVVLKTVSPKAEKAVKLRAIERFDLEFEVISRIKHPNIVKLYDHGRVAGLSYTTMEYFDTGDLKQRLGKGISQQQALKYLVQIADGLQAIHGSGIIHRDLKPANIMFRRDETLAIIDFGIAHDITRQLHLTRSGVRLGTPSYMSPEQSYGGYRTDARADLYALGVILYELLTGKRPYRGKVAKVRQDHLNAPIPRLPNRYWALQPVLEKLMAKYPDDRFESAYDLSKHLVEEYRFDTMLDFEIDEEGDFSSSKSDAKARF
ncbi:MAG: serine/threonine protein kinase [Pseudomonadota bacterium]